MKIAVINGTEQHGVTYRMKEIFLEPFREQAEVTEIYLPKDCPGFCAGCKVCFLNDERKCKDAEYTGRIEKALLEADLLVFTSPAYVFHATGAMKAMLDHFGYRWMPHRPAAQMFGKRAVIITQCLGAGDRSTAKDIRDSLSWWGISDIRVCRFRLLGEVRWDKLPEKKRASMTEALRKAAGKTLKTDFSRPARTGMITKAKFHAVRMIQKQIGKTMPDTVDYLYWKGNGWLGKARPWKH